MQKPDGYKYQTQKWEDDIKTPLGLFDWYVIDKKEGEEHHCNSQGPGEGQAPEKESDCQNQGNYKGRICDRKAPVVTWARFLGLLEHVKVGKPSSGTKAVDAK